MPELQREFVWNSRKACDLLDSIYRNYPIGTILVWKTGRRNEGQLRKQLHILPHFNSANRDIYFLIDGQQRLSVLWHFLRGEAAAVTNADGKVVDFGRVYFNAHAEDGEDLFVYRTRPTGDLAKQLVPVVDLLSSGWHHRIRDHGVRALRRVEECRRQILNYEAISSRRNRSDKHHIFPRALLSRYGFGPERFNSLLNICFGGEPGCLASRTTRSIASSIAERRSSRTLLK